MPSKYASSRAQKVKLKSLLPCKKELRIPEDNIPVVINDKLTVFIDDESKREETLLKHKNKIK